MNEKSTKNYNKIQEAEIERKYQELADMLAEGIFESDLTGRVTYANHRALVCLGLDENDMKRGLNVFSVIATQDLALARERFGKVINHEDVGAGEYMLVRKDGSTFPALVHSLAILRDGKVIGVRGVMIDISERKQVEEALHESEQRYRELTELLSCGVFEINADGRLSYANRKGLSLFGLNEDDLRNGINVFDVIESRDQDIAHENFARILKQEEIGPIEYLVKRKDRTTFPALTYSSVIMRESAVVGVRGVVVDISELKQAEQALKESEQRYRELANFLDEGVFELDLDGKFTYANRKGLLYLGFEEDDMKKGISVFSIIDPGYLEQAKKQLAATLQGEETGAAEILLKRKDGTTFPALTHGSSIIRNGVIMGVRGILFDISEIKKTEQALKDSERKYRELTDLLDEGVFEMDLDGNFTYANRKGLSYLSIEEPDLISGLNVFDIVIPQDVERAKERLALVASQQDTGPIEFQIMRKDGTTFPVLTHSSAIVRDNVVVGIRGVAFDISEIKKTEQALRESEERFRTFIKSLHEGIWVLDKDDITTFVNPRMAEILGYTEEEMLGKPVFSFNDEEWQKKTVDYMDRRKQGISEQIEGELLRKDGGRVCALLETSPILDEDGNYIGSIAGVQDITDRKLAEEQLKQAMAELDRSNKELEQFAYVTSHDLREPLRMMTSFSQLLEKRYKEKLDSTGNEYIQFIVDGASRMQKLIDDILVYSRVTTRGQPFESVIMDQVLEEVLLNLKAALDENHARITCDSLPVVQADSTQMKQVMQNLISNALKFHREEESPVVHISASQKSNEWIFTVTDNGIGMDPELFGRLFNLFQRLHPPDKYPGTGVGLAVAKKIVQRHGGRIWVESQPGKGSTFYFSIPIR